MEAEKQIEERQTGKKLLVIFDLLEIKLLNETNR